MKNELNTCFQQKFAMGSYGVRIGRAWCSWKACEMFTRLKEKIEKNIFFFTQAAQTAIYQFLLSRNFRG
jgi:hypothetical protein